MRSVRASSCEDLLAYAHDALERTDTKDTLILGFVYSDRPRLGPVMALNMPTDANSPRWFTALTPTLEALRDQGFSRVVLIAHEPAEGATAIQLRSPWLRRGLLGHGYTVAAAWVIADGMLDVLADGELLSDARAAGRLPRPFGDPRLSNTGLHLMVADRHGHGVDLSTHTTLTPQRKSTCTAVEAFGDEETDPFVVRLRAASWHHRLMRQLQQLHKPDTAAQAREHLSRATDEQVDALTVGFTLPVVRDRFVNAVVYPHIEDARTAGSQLYLCPAGLPGDRERMQTLQTLLELLIPRACPDAAVNLMAVRAWLLYAVGQGRAARTQVEAALLLKPDHTLSDLMRRQLENGKVSAWAVKAPKGP